MSNRKLKLNIENIGPLKLLNSEFETNSLKVALFATNGSGKTFISRCFNLLSNRQQNNNNQELENLVNLEATEGKFKFDFSDTTVKNLFKIDFNRNQIIEEKIDSDLILHVFNNDFIDKNVVANNYAINSSNINGEILIGDDTIDVAKDEADLKALNDNKNSVYKLITEALKACWETLTELGIRRTLNEFSQITLPNLLKHTKYNGISFEQAKKNYSTIKNIPDNLDEIIKISFNIEKNLFNKIKEALEKEVNISTIGEDFKQKILNKSIFIKNGLELIEGNTSICPFCEKNLEDKVELINQYIEYFNQEEAQFDEMIKSLINQLEDLLIDIEKIEMEYNKQSLKFYEQRTYFSDLQATEIINIDKSLFINAVSQIISLLQQKIINKKRVDFSEDLINNETIIFNFFETLKSLINSINNNIEIIERKKKDIANEQTNSRREVCLSAFGELFNSQEENIKKLEILENDIKQKQAEITAKKSKNKKNKKDKINETFEKYLKEFFNDKYTFNSEKQSLLLNEHLIKTDADKILSDGEKNIIGFCYYLALTYQKINKNADCEKLLFIIDDPISSMDYHYVYKVADIIRNLGCEINCERYRFIILTHSYEFYNLLVKNNISTLNLILSNSIISKLKEDLLLPYTEHLKFIYDVAKGHKPVSFHTPNSMRHVLETICNFNYPNKELKNFITDSEILSSDEYLYTAIQDLSHGTIRLQKPFSDEDIVKGCQKIIEYLSINHSGQITSLEE